MSKGQRKKTRLGKNKGAKRQVRYTDADRQRAIDFLVAGKRPGQVAKELGCSGESIRLWKLKAQQEGKLPSVSLPPAGHEDGSVAEVPSEKTADKDKG